MIFEVQCPKCRNKMKYESKSMILTGKRKRCVYCGRNFSVRKQLIEKVK